MIKGFIIVTIIVVVLLISSFIVNILQIRAYYKQKESFTIERFNNSLKFSQLKMIREMENIINSEMTEKEKMLEEVRKEYETLTIENIDFYLAAVYGSNLQDNTTDKN